MQTAWNVHEVAGLCTPSQLHALVLLIDSLASAISQEAITRSAGVVSIPLPLCGAIANNEEGLDMVDPRSLSIKGTPNSLIAVPV